MAEDKGSPSLNSTAVITLNVFDNRPFVPQFNESQIRWGFRNVTGTYLSGSGKQSKAESWR